MKFITQRLSVKLMVLVITAVIAIAARPYAAARYTDDVREQTIKYWADYARFLKKATDEKDDAKAAAILIQMTKELAPRGEAIKAKGQAWKKSHSANEWVKFVREMQDNTQFGESMRMKSAPAFMMRMLQSPKFQEAFGKFQQVPVDVNTTL